MSRLFGMHVHWMLQFLTGVPPGRTAQLHGLFATHYFEEADNVCRSHRDGRQCCRTRWSVSVLRYLPVILQLPARIYGFCRVRDARARICR